MRRLLFPAALMAIAATLLVSRFIQPVPVDSVDASSPLDGAEESAVPVDSASSEPAETVNNNETADGNEAADDHSDALAAVTQADETAGHSDVVSADAPVDRTEHSVPPVGQSVRAVDATGWVVSGTLVNATEGWITIRTQAGREVFLSSTPALMFEVLAEDDANTFVSAPATSAVEPTSDSAQP